MKLQTYLTEKSIKVWLDDERKAPSGWVSFKTVPELISFYEKNYKDIVEISLDHDLGEYTYTGYEFLKWLEKKVHYDEFNSVPKINVHSANPVGKKRMLQAIKSIENKIGLKVK
jgi:hypothetical protein